MEDLTPTQVVSAIKSIEKEFLPYQIKWIYDNSRFKLCEKSVRIGVTYAHSYRASKKRLFPIPNSKPIHEIFASKNLTVAKEYLAYHRKWAEGWCQLYGEGFIDFSRWTSERAVYPGGEIVIMSSDPDAFRGMEGDVTLDEFAFHEKQPELFNSAQSRIQWLGEHGQVSLISSHSHPETEFARMAFNARRNIGPFSHHRTTQEEAVEQGLAIRNPGEHRKLLVQFRNRKPGSTDSAWYYTPASVKACNLAFLKATRDSCRSPEDYDREYGCEPASLSALVSGYDYDRCTLGVVPDSLDPTRNYGDLFVGIDCGRVHDLTVVWVIERSPLADARGLHSYRTVCVKAIRNAPFPDQERMVHPIVSNEWIVRGNIDMGAQGRALADAVQDETGGAIKAIGLSPKNMGMMAENLRAFAQTQRVSFPDAADVRASVLCVRREHNNNRTLTYRGSTDNDHGDYFWACAMALAAAEPPGERTSLSFALPQQQHVSGYLN